MIAYLVVEGPRDADLLRSLVQAGWLEGVEIVPAHGLANAKGRARSLLVSRRVPLAILIDSDATSPEVVLERRQGVEEVVGIVAGRTPFRVLVAVPDLETLALAHLDDATSASKAAFLEDLDEFLRLARSGSSLSTATAGLP